jgi:hypothetical protein
MDSQPWPRRPGCSFVVSGRSLLTEEYYCWWLISQTKRAVVGSPERCRCLLCYLLLLLAWVVWLSFFERTRPLLRGYTSP